MLYKEIADFGDYLDFVNALMLQKDDIILFRGQSEDAPLLPSIARTSPYEDTTSLEKEMLAELKRRTQLTIKTKLSTDWDWLIYAQHYGLKTRLLDWSSNPLTALWFACINEHKQNQDSFVYIFTADDSFLIKSSESPFNNNKTRILRPALNNERIIAQAGWFTAHKYSLTSKRFVKLQSNPELSKKIIRVSVPSAIKKDVLKRLSIFGINNQSLFPDITGVCNHLNWMYTN